MHKTIFLVGARAAGKTSLGGMLATAINWRFSDTDIHILNTSKMTVEDIVKAEGWPGFRKRESQALRDVTGHNVVIATGGGMILAEENRKFMKENGTVFYLSAPAEILAERLIAGPKHTNRPSLTGRPLHEEIAEVLNQREELYQDAAHYVVDASKTMEQVRENVLEILNSRPLKTQ